MSIKQRPDRRTPPADRAFQNLQAAASILHTDHTTIDKLEQASAHLRDAIKHLDSATDYNIHPSVSAVLNSAAETATTALGRLDQAHQTIQDEYLNEDPTITPSNVRQTLHNAASQALKDTKKALDLIQEAGPQPHPPFVPPEVRKLLHNRLIIGAAAAALVLSVALAAYNPKTFALMTAITTIVLQQATLVWAMISTTNPRTTPRQTDFYAAVAAGLTLLLAGCILSTGLGPRSALQLAGIALLIGLGQWTIARTIAAYNQRALRKGRP